MLTTTPIDELARRAGTELGVSDDVLVSQETVDAFAEVTGDYQWIHTDPVRAAASPFGGTIAHGYLTLALAPALLDAGAPLDGYAMAVNYGLDKLRFPRRCRSANGCACVSRSTRSTGSRAAPTLTLTLTFERATGGKPVCVANALYRVYE